jgi:hypothetical protein
MPPSPKTLTRDIATPVTVVLFVVSTVTGIMLLAHWQSGLVRFSHEWLSLVFAAIAVWHLAKNWRPFVAYLKRRLPLVAFAASLAVSVIVTGLTGSTAAVSPGAVFHAVSGATLAAAAPAFGLDLDEALARLRAAGIETAAPDETLEAIGARAGLGGPGIMTVLARAPASAED